MREPSAPSRSFSPCRPALALLAAVLAAPAAAAPVGVTRLFTGVVSASGANGTEWRSELTLANPSASPVDLLLEVVPRDGTSVAASAALTLAAGETRQIPNLYAFLAAPSGAGILRLTGDALAWLRTYNKAAQGTFGLGVPGVPSDGGYQAGAPVVFPITTPSDSAREFRSNLLLTNLSSSKVTFTLSAGAVVKTLDVEAGVFHQIDRIGDWLGVSAGTTVLTIQATGRWTGLVTTIDPVLGDPTGVRGVDLEPRDVRLFAGVASAGGLNDTRWRSEAQIYNPTAAFQDVKLEILPRGGSTVAATSTIRLGPLELRRLADVYAAVGVASGAGILRVTGNVVTWVRTFNQGPEATFGTDVPEIVPGVGFGRGASVAFPVSATEDISKGFRSNFLAYNHESRPITLTFTSGAATGTFEVPAGSFVQRDNLGAVLALSPGTHTVQVTGDGRWSAIVTAIDPYLGDPTTVRGILTTPNPAPTASGDPVGVATSTVIGAAGGTLLSPDGKVSLKVPAGALAAPVALTIQPVTNLAWGGVGDVAYAIGPAGTVFAAPASLTFAAADEDANGTGLSALGVAMQDAEGYWVWDTAATRDAAAKTVTISISKLGGGASASAGEGREPLDTPGDRRSAALVRALMMLPPYARVKEGESVNLRVVACYPPDPNLAPPDPSTTYRGFECTQAIPMLISAGPWYVNDVAGGNATFGTVRVTDTYANLSATYTAPGAVPDPSTVSVTTRVGGLNLAVKLGSRIRIGGSDPKGTFTLQIDRPDLPSNITATGTANFTRPVSNENGVKWEMEGTIKIVESFPLFNSTCTCADPVQPIPVDTYFSVQRKPALGQHWVMPAARWDFRCNPGGFSVLVFASFIVADAGNCSVPVWLPLQDEEHLFGTFVHRCGMGYTVKGSWSFTSE